ncbi:hypothetical protein AGLY_006410 [Aphis glycines]|uniref:Uncharacterized protein n=1 Tax=Aphis glycines TaxID=307491 RepID=A0A6G0TQZ9_APHGL|nr:hypothetical protein AGLY_006410 [Aphis glycines]
MKIFLVAKQTQGKLKIKQYTPSNNDVARLPVSTRRHRLHEDIQFSFKLNKSKFEQNYTSIKGKNKKSMLGITDRINFIYLKKTFEKLRLIIVTLSSGHCMLKSNYVLRKIGSNDMILSRIQSTVALKIFHFIIYKKKLLMNKLGLNHYYESNTASLLKKSSFDQSIARKIISVVKKRDSKLEYKDGLSTLKILVAIQIDEYWVPLCYTLGGGVDLGLGITYEELCINFSNILTLPKTFYRHFKKKILRKIENFNCL